jgi:hypothetical protein
MWRRITGNGAIHDGESADERYLSGCSSGIRTIFSNYADIAEYTCTF